MNLSISAARLKALALLATLACAGALPAHAATFTVNSTGDSVDVHPGDGICADAAGQCTLRAAIMESNALAGVDTIDLTGINDPNNPIILTIKGADETYAASTASGFVAVATHDASIGDLNITDSTNIVGAGSGKTVIEWSTADQSAGAADRVFHVEAVSANISVSISGLTVLNGYTPPPVNIETTSDGKIWQFKRHGGGIAIGASAATSLLDPTITHGSGSGGTGGGGGGGHGGDETAAAIDSVTLSDVHVIDCISGGDGGGIYNAAPLTLTGSVISGNTAAANGGGIYGSAGMTITSTTIGTMVTNAAFSKPNHAENGGGLFDTGLHTTDIRASALVGNTATGGGAISGRSTTIDNLTDSTVSGNVAQDTGGAISTNGRVTLTNVTLVGNKISPVSSTEAPSGAGLSSFGSGQFTYVNTIIANNVVTGTTNVLSNCGSAGSGSASNFLTSLGHNLEDADSCNLTAAGDLKNTDPQVQALANNGGPTETMALPSSSPAIDAGDNSKCPNNDQRGDIRPADGNLDGNFVCDIGAFELFVHTADVHIDDMTAPDQTYTGDSITVTIVAHNDPTATTSASGVVISTGALPTGFTLTSATLTTTAGSSPCTSSAGVVTCTVGTLAVGDAATATLVGSMTTPGTMSIVGNVSSTAPIDPNLGNNTATVHVLVTGNADMGITASGSATPVNSGTNTDLAFTVTNHGPDTANNARAAAFLPPGLVYQSIAVSQGTCTYSSIDGSVDCAIGTVASGATVTGTLTVSGAVNGPVSALFGTSAQERDLQPDNDTATVSLQIIGLADLQLQLGTGSGVFRAGDVAPLTATVTNVAGLATTNVKMTITLPSGMTFVSAGTGSTCSAAGAVVTCTTPTLGAGAQYTATFSVRLVTAGRMSVTGVVSSDLQDPVPANNQASLTVAIGDSGGGGCAYDPGQPFDPTLAALLAAALGGLLIRPARRTAASAK